MQNPLLVSFETPHQLPPFEIIKSEHYEPAIKSAIESAKSEIEKITRNEEKPTFENTITALEVSGELLSRITPILFNLNSAETSSELQEVAQKVSPLLTTFDSDIKQNKALFDRIDSIFQQRNDLELNEEQLRLLDKTHKSFIRSGAGLDRKQQRRFQEIAVELSRLQLTFGEHVLAASNAYELLLKDANQVRGLPDDYLERAQSLARNKGYENGWLITLQAPSYIPFMEYADNRELRKELFMAFSSKAFKGDENDNTELVRKIVSLRQELSELLGYQSYAEYVLDERMASKPQNVLSFLDNLLNQAKGPADREVEELKHYMHNLGATHELEKWDWAYYSEKLRKQKYNLDDELIKPYLKLENVIQGVFETAERLYDLTFEANPKLPVYHEEVKAYEVYEQGKLKSILYADFFPREGKRPGAWMTSFRDQHRAVGENIVPVISIVCNFTPSLSDKPSLLKFEEVTTLFHEFGHALHGMLSDVTYPSLSGTSVCWDFVELPSQVFENWCYERECLDLFAKHFETGEDIPQQYIDRIKASSTYHEAYATVRQLSFGILDMAYHQLSSDHLGKLEDIEAFEKKAMAKTELLPSVKGVNMSVQFSHIFAGGYAAGYYSYKWAEVLDADAFELFKEKGVFDKATALLFKDHILSQGDTKNPLDLYRQFRGKEPDSRALLKRAGLAD